MTELATAWMHGCASGFFIGVIVARCRRSSYAAPPTDEQHSQRLRRSYDHAPATALPLPAGEEVNNAISPKP